jgi:hypothetical protein
MLSWVLGLIQTDNQDQVNVDASQLQQSFKQLSIEDVESDSPEVTKMYSKLIEDHFPDCQSTNDPKSFFKSEIELVYGITLEEWHKLKSDCSFVDEIDDPDVKSDLYILAAEQGNLLAYIKCPESLSINHFTNVLKNGSYQVANYYLEILASETEENLFEIPHVLNELIISKRLSVARLILDMIRSWEQRYAILLVCSKFNYLPAVKWMLTTDKQLFEELQEVAFIAAADGAMDVVDYFMENNDYHLRPLVKEFAKHMANFNVSELHNSSIYFQLLPFMRQLCKNDEEIEFFIGSLKIIEELDKALSDIKDIKKWQSKSKSKMSKPHIEKKPIVSHYEFKRRYLQPEQDMDELPEPKRNRRHSNKY